jgi:hypothetical protein
MKMRPVGAELFYADGRTDRQRDMTKLIVAFRNFAKAPKKTDDEIILNAPFGVLHNTHYRFSPYISNRSTTYYNQQLGNRQTLTMLDCYVQMAYFSSASTSLSVLKKNRWGGGGGEDITQT